MNIKILILLFTAVFFITLNPAAYAKTYLNGYYQFLTSSYREGNHDWNFNSPDNYFQLKFYSNPLDNDKCEAFGQLAAGGSNNKEGARLENGDLKLKFYKEKYGFESYLYSKQDRLWTGYHTLNFVNGNSDYEGIRNELWWNNLGGWWNATFVLANHKDDGSDVQLFQLRRDFLQDGKLKLSFNGAKKIWGEESNKYNSYLSQFIEYKLTKDLYLRSEISTSKDPSQTADEKNYAGKFEFRWLKFYSEKYGELGYAFTYENYGQNYRNYIGGNNWDYINYYNEMYYSLPKKSITFTLRFNYKEDPGHNFKEREFYFENYTEFIEGYKFKTYYKRWNNESDEYPEFLLQIEKIVKEFQYKIQYRKIKNGTTKTKNDLFGLDNKLNLLNNLSLYWRIVYLKDKELNFSKENLFAQLRYDLGWDAECYLEYGESWYNDYDLTLDGDFVGYNTNDYLNRRTVDVIKLKLSINF